MGQPFNYNGPGVQTQLDTSGVAKMPVNAGNTGYEAIMSRLNPQLEQQRNMEETRLRNQGLVAGGEAYDNARQNLDYSQNDARLQAASQSVGLDMAANQQGYNQALQGGQFGNTATQQALGQQLQLRNQPLNEITGLMSGSQIQNPQFQGYNGAAVAPANYGNIAQQQGQWNQGLYNAQVGQQNAQQQGLYGLGAAGIAAMAS